MSDAQKMWDDAVATVERIMLQRHIDEIATEIMNRSHFDKLPEYLQKVFVENERAVLIEVTRRRVISELGGTY